MVGAKTGGMVYRVGVAAAKFDAAFDASDKEGTGAMECTEASEVEVCAIHDVEGGGFGHKGIEGIDVMLPAVGNLYKHWDWATQIE